MTKADLSQTETVVTGGAYLRSHCLAVIAQCKNIIAEIRRIGDLQGKSAAQIERAIAPYFAEMNEARRRLREWS